MTSGRIDAIEAAPVPVAVVPSGRPYSGLVSRLTALAVDVALLTVACLSISVLPGLAWSEVVGRSPSWLGTASGIVAGVLPWAYFTVCWSLNGQTAGNLLLGIAVQRDDGRRIGFIRAALRAAIGLTFAPLWLVGMLNILFNSRRRAWIDLLMRTVVRPTVRAGDQP
jgi:uncharacterized RDD family membrane protein YckC